MSGRFQPYRAAPHIHHAALVVLADGGRDFSVASRNALTGGVTVLVSWFSYAAAKAGGLDMTLVSANMLGPPSSPMRVP